MVLEFLDVPASGGNVFVKSKGKQNPGWTCTSALENRTELSSVHNLKLPDWDIIVSAK